MLVIANGMISLSPYFLRVCTNMCPSSLEEELARLEKNKDRRLAREKAKGITAPSPAPDTAMSPDGDAAATAGPSKQQPQGTQRKCANCGQVGHIKTNKKYYCSRCHPLSSKSAHSNSKCVSFADELLFPSFGSFAE